MLVVTTENVAGQQVREVKGQCFGVVVRSRGIATRRRLLDCTDELLTKTSYRDIKVIDIAREAGTSPATFYQYFPDVEQAVLVLAEELAGDAEYLAELVRGDWRGDRGAQTAQLAEPSKLVATLVVTGVGVITNEAVGTSAGGRMTPTGTR